MVFVLFLYIGWLVIILLASSGKIIRKNQEKYLIAGSVFLIALFAAWVFPKEMYDLFRHYKEIEIVKNSEIRFWDFVFHSSRITDANYRHAYSFNGMRFIISKCFPKETLPFCSVTICYGVLGYILQDLKKRGHFSNGYIGMSLLISSGFLPLLYIYSGIRNEIAMAIIALAVYLRIYKQLKLIPFTVLTGLAVTMHPLALVAVPFVFLSRLRPGKAGIILIICIPGLLYPLMEQFRFSKNDFLKYLGAKFYNYTFVHVYSQGRTFYYAAILLTFMVMVLSIIKIQQEKKEDQIFVNFLSWFSIFALANIKSYQIMMRLPYLFGVLAPAIVYTLMRAKIYRGWKKIIPYGSMYGSALVGMFTIYQNFMWMV